MSNTSMTNKESVPLPIRVDKTLEWLEISRDSWKEKAKVAKTELKKKTFAVKRARDDRAQAQQELKESRLQIQRELKEREREIAELKAQLTQVGQQLEDFKKKSLCRLLKSQDITLTGTASS